MNSKRTNAVKYTWKRSRQAFLNRATRVILEEEIAQSRFDSECAAMFKIALETELAVTTYGAPTATQRKSALKRVYQAFYRDLRAMVYNKMPREWEYENS
jgi:hypothetical protein